MISVRGIPRLRGRRIFGSFMGMLRSLGCGIACGIIGTTSCNIPREEGELLLLTSGEGGVDFVTPARRRPIAMERIVKGLPPVTTKRRGMGSGLRVATALSRVGVREVRRSIRNKA